MKGLICLWSGEIADIPAGWALCDGTLGTPDLRDRFVLGASEARPPLGIGGVKMQSHPFTGDGHSHTIPAGTGLAAGTDYALETESDPAVGDTDTLLVWPSFMTLCYIQKL